MIPEVIIQKGEKREIMLVHTSPESEARVIRLSGEGAEVSVQEIFLSSVESKLTIVHDAPRTKSRVSARGVAKKAQNILSHAIVVIPKHAQLSDSFVSQKFMLLDSSARAEAIPSLEIEANEVKASHAATVSSVDEEKVFYLASRGLSEVDARRLLVESFLNLPNGFEEVFEKWQE